MIPLDILFSSNRFVRFFQRRSRYFREWIRVRLVAYYKRKLRTLEKQHKAGKISDKDFAIRRDALQLQFNKHSVRPAI